MNQEVHAKLKGLKLRIRRVLWNLSYQVRLCFYAVFPKQEVLKRMEDSPRALLIELTNICNANCIFCAYQFQERRRQVMADELFEKTLGDYVAMGGGDLCMYVVVGDPLVDPNFIKRVQRARAESSIACISTITNGLNLHRVGVRNLLTCGLNEVRISTSGFDAAMYQRVYRSNHYEQMRRNVLDLLRTNHELGKPVRIAIDLRFDRPVEDVINLHDFQEIKSLADEINWCNDFDNWSGRIKQESLSGEMKLRKPRPLCIKKRIPCAMLWCGVGILVDGSATACPCRDLNGDSDLVLGNIHDTPLKQLCHGERLKQIRQDWFVGRSLPNICRDCTFYHPYTKWMCKEFLVH